MGPGAVLMRFLLLSGALGCLTAASAAQAAPSPAASLRDRASAPQEPAGAAAAQEAQESQPDARHRVLVHSYDETMSRRLFRACDGSGDDRLDVFEARDAFAELGDPEAPGWFRRLDADRDGFLEWPEFDGFVRQVLRTGNALRLRLEQPPDPVDAPEEPLPARSPAARYLDLFDRDRDGRLALAEARALLEELGLPPALMNMLPLLDRDRDGILGQAELAPVLAQLRLEPLAGPGGSVPKLGGVWSEIDRNGSGGIDEAELGAALRRIDPQLARWAAQVLAGRDDDHNGWLAASELPGAGTEEPPAPAPALPEAPRVPPVRGGPWGR